MLLEKVLKLIRRVVKIRNMFQVKNEKKQKKRTMKNSEKARTAIQKRRFQD